MAIAHNGAKQIAVLVYPGVNTIELVGTVSVLNGLGITTGFQTATVAQRCEPVDADAPLKLVPERSFDEVDHPFALIVPGGGPRSIEALGDERLLSYVRAAAGAAFVGSVGTGSLILAAAGLLAGKRATTHRAYRGILEHLGASYSEQPWVEDGPFITAGGSAGGIDMALHLVAQHRDERTARQIQLWIEYDPQPPFGRIARSAADAPPPILTQHVSDIARALAHRPELLEAVGRVSSPAGDTVARLAGARQLTAAQPEQTIAFVLYPGLTAFDLVGPLQVIAQLARLRPEIRPVVVGERIAPMDTDAGVQLLPELTFEQVPHPYALVVPGGTRPTFQAMSNQAIRNYVRTAAATAEIVGSVCTGALILASVGLLEGRQATTHWACSAVLESFGATYQRKRWVEDGTFITAAGVSAGIDMGLELAARLTDEATARQVQRWLDYDPEPPFGKLDYDAMGLRLRAGRAWVTLTAPLLTARPKRLTRQERATDAQRSELRASGEQR